jgi:hypothetical protein
MTGVHPDSSRCSDLAAGGPVNVIVMDTDDVGSVGVAGRPVAMAAGTAVTSKQRAPGR